LSYAPAKIGSQNVWQLPTNRQQVCDVFSKKKDSRARSPWKGRWVTMQSLVFVQLDHAQHSVTETVFFWWSKKYEMTARSLPSKTFKKSGRPDPQDSILKSMHCTGEAP